MKMNTKLKKILKIITIIVVSLVAVVIIVASTYFYRNMNYWQTDYKKTVKAGFIEKQATLPDGAVINYAEGPDNGDALLLIHGQTGAWQDYARVLPELAKNWHVFAVDCYGHGQSSHDESKYYMRENGNDLIWFVDAVIGKSTLVSGHSSGGLLASYVAAYGGENIAGAVLEDPPVFSTEPDYFEQSFAYQDTYKLLHEYRLSDQNECWEAYYLRNCLWGQLYMASSMDNIADHAQKYYEKHPNEPVQIFFMPESINAIFLYGQDYDSAFGENFYNYSWHKGIDHATLMNDIKVPTLYLHIEEQYTDNGILMAAASNEQAERATGLMENCELRQLVGNHNIHRFNSKVFIESINLFYENNRNI